MEKNAFEWHYSTAKVKCIIVEVRSTPLRSYSWGNALIKHRRGNMYSDALSPSTIDGENAAPITSEFGADTSDVNFQDDESNERPQSDSGIKKCEIKLKYLYDLILLLMHL